MNGQFWFFYSDKHQWRKNSLHHPKLGRIWVFKRAWLTGLTTGNFTLLCDSAELQFHNQEAQMAIASLDMLANSLSIKSSRPSVIGFVFSLFFPSLVFR